MFNKLYIFLFGFFILLNAVKAQEQKLDLLPFVINYTTKDGLPSNETYCVVQDKKGYIWIGTDRGVVRYDNKEFEVFTTENGLLDNVVFHIQIDEDGKVWFFPWNNKIFYYEYGKGFSSFKYNETIQDFLGDIDFTFEKIERDSEGNYYLSSMLEARYVLKIKPNGTYELILDKFDHDLQEITFTIKEGVNSIIKGGGDSVVLGKDLTIHHAIGKKKISSFKNVNFEKAISLSWPSFFEEENASYMITGKCMTKISKTDTIPIFLERRMFATKTKDGYIVGRNVKDDSFIVDIYWQESIDPSAKKQLLLRNTFKTGALKDDNNGVWVTTHNKGVFYIPDKSYMQNKEIGNINGMIPKKEEVLFYNSDKSIYTIKNHTRTTIEKRKGEKIVFEDLMYQDKFKQSRKVYDVFSIEDTNSFSDFLLQVALESTFNYRLLESNDILLLSRSLLNKYYTESNKSQRLKDSLNTKIICFEKDSKNNLWFGARDGIYQLKNNKVVRPKFSFENLKERIQDIKFFEKKNLMFLATIGSGLYVFKDSVLVKHFLKKDGLSSNSINQLYIDATAKMWIATNNGFHFLDLKENRLQLHDVITNTSKLTSPNIKQIYVRDSLIYLGADNGLNLIDWKEFKENKNTHFPIYVKKLKVNQKPTSLDTLLTSPLTYEQNNIEITFRALDYKNLSNTMYRYRLSDKSNWQETASTTIRLIDQKPGNYDLQIEAKNDFQTWIPAQQTITFRIMKPYWQTIWFQVILYVLSSLILLTIIFVFYRNKEKQRQLNEELNSNMQKLFSAQLKPHFVFNSLNAIQNFILKNERMASTEYLGKFATLIRNVFENSNEVFITLEKEFETLNIYIELEQLRFSNKFDYKWSVDPQIDMSKTCFPCNLLQPIVENAIQHGLLNKSEKGLLNISIERQENSLLIVVKDNGVGRSYAQSIRSKLYQKSSKGLELTKKRLQILSKTEQKPTNLLVKDIFNNEKAIGTEVQIIIPLIYTKQ